MRNLTDVSTTAYAILQQDSNSLQIEHQDLCLPPKSQDGSYRLGFHASEQYRS